MTLDRQSVNGNDGEFNMMDEKKVSHVSECASFTEYNEMNSQYVNDIRKILDDFIRDGNVAYQNFNYDPESTQTFCEDTLHNVVEPEMIQSPEFQLALQSAIPIAMTTYAHLEDVSTRQWICLYTTCLIYLDDLAKTDISAVREFHVRFTSSQPQMHSLLDSLVLLLRDAWSHFVPSGASVVVSTSLDFVAALIFEHDQRQEPVNQSAIDYPRWIRTKTGASAAYVVFTFPPDIPFATYIQIIPTMLNYISDVNDLFSFYKEEIGHEDKNHISLLAQLTQKSKLQCMKDLAQQAVDASRRCQAVLSVDPKALKIFTNCFLPGYAAFHAAARERYKLDDLGLQLTSSVPPM